jgi:LPS-assembly protein
MSARLSARFSASLPRSPAPLRAVALALALLALPTWGWAQAIAPQAPAAVSRMGAEASKGQNPQQLRRSLMLQPRIPRQQRAQQPLFLEGGRVEGRTELETTVEGQAVLRRADIVMRADRIHYDQPTDTARAQGQVRVNRAGDVFEGPALELQVDAFQGFFSAPRYRLLKNDAHGQAERIDFLDNDRINIHRSSYTTCQRSDERSWRPAWMLTAKEIRLDNEAGVGVATGAMLRVFGVPVVPLPYLSFPLSDDRKSGLLPATTGGDSVNGTVVSVPYYWNIAPNRDATITPTLMGLRGLELGSEFRYLEPDFRGRARLNALPDDRLRDGRNRWALGLEHQDRLAREPFPGGLGVTLRVNRVSDNDYWRDFGRNSITQSQRLLGSEGALTWTPPGARWNLSARALAWQTLQSPDTIIPPYDRLPQVTARYADNLPAGMRGQLLAEYTQFQSVSSLTLQPNAQRALLIGTLARTWRDPGYFVTPQLRLHARHYQFDAPLSVSGESSAGVTVPTFSLDSGLILERDTQWFGRSLLQTLEPRAYYVYTPHRAQSQLPNYDSAATDFNFATIFTDGAYAGNDRISDNNLITLGLTSRFQDAANGAQLARLGVAQRLRFADQRVTLTAADLGATDRISDLLVGGSVNWTPQWSTDLTAQYDPRQRLSERATLNARYSPSRYRLVQGAYRFQRDTNRQVDLSWQWPVNDLWGDRGQDQGSGRGLGGDRWYSVGRLNMNLVEKRLIDSIVGLEYDGCCWVGRVLLERLRVGAPTAQTRLLFQIELIGFSRLGDNVLGALRTNIPRYEFLHGQVAPPSRFTRYD